MASNSIEIVFGTANFGKSPSKDYTIGPQTVDEGQPYLSVLKEFNVSVLDAARNHVGHDWTVSNGESEVLLKDLGAPRAFTINTKAAGTFDYSGTREAILESCRASMEALGVESVELYYLHTPDRATPASETMDAIQELYLAGRFKRFGISNLRADEVVELYDYAKSHGYVLPSVYQGNYNLLSRRTEEELLPILRERSISFRAYSPLCCGLLINAGPKLAAATGRWDTSHMGGKYMHGLYNKPSYIHASDEFQKLCASRSISPAGSAYRWMAYHSRLKKEAGDGMVLGASSPQQLRDSLQQIALGPLELDVAAELERFWDIVKNDAPPYHV